MLIKTEHTSQSNTQNLLNIREYMRITNPQTIEPSNVVYLSVLDAKADSKDTIMQVLQDANKRYMKGLKKQHIIKEGDAKVYELIQSLKHEYPEEFHWVLPYPGDWHLLRNFQQVLMKAYYDAGLREIAQTAGYPAAAIQSCSQFKRTHHFILEAWEALYRVIIEEFTSTTDSHSAVKDCIKELLESNN